MIDDARRYSFSPLERRGILLGLGGGQLATIGLGLLGALLALRAVSGPAGPAAGGALVVVATTMALRGRAGRPLAQWVPLWVWWRARRGRGPVLSVEPLLGRPAGRSVPASSPRPATLGRAAPVDLRGLRLLDVASGPGDPPVGVVHDVRTGLVSAVVPVEGRAFALMDPADQAGRLDSWRTVLCGLARPGSPLRRVQWVQRGTGAGPADLALTSPPGSPGSGSAGTGPGSEPGPADAARSYAALVADVVPSLRSRSVWLVLAVGAGRGLRPPRAGRAGTGRVAGPLEGPGRDVDALLRELRLLDGRLRAADLRGGLPLRADQLGQVLADAYQVDRPLTGGRPGDGAAGPAAAWPVACDEQWSAVRVDGAWHATYWIAEWPRVEVPPGFLGPLLLGAGSRSVSVVMAPVPADRAIREARAARTADLADEQLRSRAGFLPSVRRGLEAEGAVRREAELADGQAEFRFSGYVTVSASARAGLDAACVEAEQAAQAAHLELRRLYGRQAEALTWTLPLARGLQ